MMDSLEEEIIPMYYHHPQRWQEIVQQGMRDILPYFDADQMATEYYDRLYAFQK